MRASSLSGLAHSMISLRPYRCVFDSCENALLASSLLTNSTNPNPLHIINLRSILPVTLGVHLLRKTDLLDCTICLEELAQLSFSGLESQVLDYQLARLEVLLVNVAKLAAALALVEQLLALRLLAGSDA